MMILGVGKAFLSVPHPDYTSLCWVFHSCCAIDTQVSSVVLTVDGCAIECCLLTQPMGICWMSVVYL